MDILWLIRRSAESKLWGSLGDEESRLNLAVFHHQEHLETLSLENLPKCLSVFNLTHVLLIYIYDMNNAPSQLKVRPSR